MDGDIQWMCNMRGVKDPCTRCIGSGVLLYGSTATWRGGMGCASMTRDVCHECWGTGDAFRKGVDLRAMTNERKAWEADQCAQWLTKRAGLSFSTMREHMLLLADVVAKEARKRKPAGVRSGQEFWYSRAAESFAATIRELSTKASQATEATPPETTGSERE